MDIFVGHQVIESKDKRKYLKINYISSYEPDEHFESVGFSASSFIVDYDKFYAVVADGSFVGRSVYLIFKRDDRGNAVLQKLMLDPDSDESESALVSLLSGIPEA